ncbi:Pentatricopeptide repeat-containing protein [Canna indica]|uniref:Pentatricopeptide repeat-containing protein n=1 Tax=Canna indica TaxID=4628 RepID=A0AAQ3K7J0_9LILI|nr:Pentatricopeptide repeat-containing protein [Canna indica]
MAAATISTFSTALTSKEPPFVERVDRNSPTVSLKFCKSFREIKQIHGQMVRAGTIHLPSAASKLIAAYSGIATPKSLDYAIAAFELLGYEGEANVFLWNTLIRGHSSAGSIKEAIELYIRMVCLGVMPDRFTFPPLIAVCSKVASLVEGEQIHGALTKMGKGGGTKDDIFIANSLIHFYVEIGEMDLAQQLFDGMTERNVVSWTSLIDGYARSDNPEKAIYLFHEMLRHDKHRPNSVTMACVVSACARLQDSQEVDKIFSYITNFGIEMNPTLFNSVVDMFMKVGAVDAAERLFDECASRDIVLWNTMVSNYVHLGMTKKALAIFNKLMLIGETPDRIAIVAGVSACAQLSELVVGKQFHGYILRNRLDLCDTVSNAIIDMYMKCEAAHTAFEVFKMMPNKTIVSWNTLINGCIMKGDLSSAQKHFYLMPQRDLVSWNTMIAGLVQANQFEAAIGLFREMQVSGFKPDKMTMAIVASACGYLGALDLARWTYTYISRNKIKCDVKLNTALVDMFAKCGDSKNSIQVFDNMLAKDVSAWTAAIGAMAVEGNGNRALDLFNDMIKYGLKPDGVVFAEVLTACSHGGLVEEGRRFFSSMSQDYSFPPEIIHYGCMVDLLGRAGLLEEARNLIETMPMEPNDVIWGALLAASCVHHDVELAEYAANQVLALSPKRSGVRVLLSNLYASVGRWQDVSRVRLDLNDTNIRKHPGSSLIEVDGMIHEFTSGDVSHPQMNYIVEMLEEICERITAAGYVLDMSNVLMDVEKSEKEYILSHHSEKIAVAFGIISTSHGVPIHIVKNLRTCADCHSFMKFVSVVYDREITIRDYYRFHHFHGGRCSCKDYW